MIRQVGHETGVIDIHGEVTAFAEKMFTDSQTGSMPGP